MMATILNYAILDSAILHKTLIQTSSIWLKLIHCYSTSWWQPSWILQCWIQTLPSWIQTPCYLLSDSLKNTLPPLWLWLKLIQSDYLDDGNHLEFCHLGFSHFAQNSDSFLFNLTQSHSFWLNLMMAAILNSAILYSAICTKKLHSCILTQIDDCSHLEFCYFGFSHFSQKKLHLFILTQLDDGSHLEFCHLDSDTAILDSTPCYLLSDSLKNTLPLLWFWLKLIPSD